MAFEFSLSSNAVTLNPDGTVSVTITQTSSDPQAVQYGVNSRFNGGWDAPAFLDQFGNVTYAFSPTPARITGNGTLTLTFSASSAVASQTLVVTVFALQQMTGDPKSTVSTQATVTITIT
jgi:hypothetical protein